MPNAVGDLRASNLRASILRAGRATQAVLRNTCAFAAIAFATGAAAQEPVPRTAYPLDGRWELSLDEGQSWREVQVPGTFEAEIDPEFDGVAWFRRQLEPRALGANERLLLHFEAVATEAAVWLNGRELGRHLGGWTPFRVDLSAVAREMPEGPWELRVRVDEKVGHHTQGFLPIIAPHFGGIWQSVEVLRVSDLWIDDLRALATGSLEDGCLHLEVPLGGSSAANASSDEPEAELEVEVSARLRGSAQSFATQRYPISRATEPQRLGYALRDPAGAIVSPEAWEPLAPKLYDVELVLRRGARVLDRHRLSAGFRTIAAQGRTLLLNGRPLNVRGVLNWGLHPSDHGPLRTETLARAEIERAQALGFNLMKFCLWMPPRRTLELCDELGMLAWIEYPTWHASLIPANREELVREYDEFFHRDRRHPAVILRSLTCETGPSADLELLRELYELAHRRVPSTLVIDDSSWIQWNRIHDAYDDHPYGNNHTWLATLERLDRHIAERAAKPLLLGEAIAADTWYGPTDPLAAEEPTAPLWRPLSASDARAWLKRLEPLVGAESLAHLTADSLRYALAMRKFQIETYRRRVPAGGYVVSVIRDFRLAAMGLIDPYDQLKWPAESWAWHGERQLALVSEGDRRSFRSGAPLSLALHYATADPTEPFALKTILALHAESRADESETTIRGVISGRWERTRDERTSEQRGDYAFELPALDVERPTRHRLRAHCEDERGATTNEWNLWVVPAADQKALSAARAHSSLRGDDLPPQLLALPRAELSQPPAPAAAAGAQKELLVARHLDDALLERLDAGARVLLLPRAERHSFPLREHWFLRGAPLVNRRHPLGQAAHELLVELQHFDLAGPVVPEIDAYLEHTRPLLLLWDAHDLDRVKTHGLVYEMPVGRGWLAVSALDHRSAAGEWLLTELLAHLAQTAAPSSATEQHSAEVLLSALRAELAHRAIDLTARRWKFQPDPEARGAEQGWQRSEHDDAAWPEIGIDRHWDAQGHAALDGWAWYRLHLDLPADWPVGKAYLEFTGVDDAYVLYVDGEEVGSGGDIAARRTAFEERKSHDLGRFARPGERLAIAVAVYDWQGAGGIFRPVSLQATPPSAAPPILRQRD
ncbi:MAG: hypothetical protein IPN34_23165 [Planctomycetes bacterium]|nr:hypothetical protein [Planctomycetota bacterium]